MELGDPVAHMHRGAAHGLAFRKDEVLLNEVVQRSEFLLVKVILGDSDVVLADFCASAPPVSCFITCPNPSPGSFLLGMSGLPPGSYLVGRDCDLPLRGKPPTLVQCVSLENKTALKWSLIR